MQDLVAGDPAGGLGNPTCDECSRFEVLKLVRESRQLTGAKGAERTEEGVQWTGR